MDSVHLHLILNHLPVLAVIIGFFVLLPGVIWRSRAASAIGALLLISAAIVVIPVYLTGRSSEDIAEALPGVTENVIDQHETAAVTSLGLALLSGVLAFGSLVFSRRSARHAGSYLMILTLFTSLLAGTALLRTANLGGQIRHTEIRSGSPGSTGSERTRHPASARDSDEDDEH